MLKHSSALVILVALAVMAAHPVSAALSTDRDAPTPLASSSIAGRLGESPAVSYYVGFVAGPGEVQLTLDTKGPVTGRTVRVTVFDRDAQDLGNVWVVATERGERRVLRVDVGAKQPLVAQITIDAGGPRADVVYRIRVAGPVELARPGIAAPPSPAPRRARERAGPLSTDRDAPTPLTSPRVAGRLGAASATSYYVGFVAGPGEVRLTLDTRGPVTGRTVRLTVFDRDARDLGNVWVVATEREERRVLRVDVGAKQPLVAQITIDAGGARADVAYRIQLAGAVELAGPPPATAAPAAPPASPTAPATSPSVSRGEFTFKVTYRVSGSAEQVSLTYRDAQGGTQQTSAKLPWQHTFDARGGSFLYVSAQNNQNWGAVTCEILIDGEPRTNSTSSGAFVIAECSNAADRR
jgi:hypothetical protein